MHWQLRNSTNHSNEEFRRRERYVSSTSNLSDHVTNSGRCDIFSLVQDRVSNLERELEGARALLKEQERHSIAARIFLDSHILDPFTDLLDKCHRFNNRVQDIARFLSQCLIYRPPDDFQDELDRCYSKCKEIIGPEMADLLRGQSQKAESLSSQPVPALFARMVCMVSLIGISVLQIRGDVLDINQRSEFLSLRRTYKE